MTRPNQMVVDLLTVFQDAQKRYRHGGAYYDDHVMFCTDIISRLNVNCEEPLDEAVQVVKKRLEWYGDSFPRKDMVSINWCFRTILEEFLVGSVEVVDGKVSWTVDLVESLFPRNLKAGA